MDLYHSLEQKLRRLQSPARFAHSKSVARLAGELGEKHGWDPKKARLAGLLHDWAKEWNPADLMKYVKKHRLKVPGYKFVVKTSPNVLHAYVGADTVQRQGFIRDKNSLSAIRSHTLGALVMNQEQKILYVADLASYDRRFQEAGKIREMAFSNLNEGFAAAVALKISAHLRKRKPLHPLTIAVWNRVVCGLKTS